MAFAWKWSKPPSPEALAQLPARTRDVVLKSMQLEGPRIGKMIRDRVRFRDTIAKDGNPKPIPPYSKRYAKQLADAGLSTSPDYTITGTLLNHLRGRIRVVRNEIELQISPHGAASRTTGTVLTKGRKGTKKEGRAGYWWREPYTYYDKRRQRNVSVSGSWIRIPPEAKAAKKWRKGQVKTLYNAHLANRLAMRLGRGLWRTNYSADPPSPLISITGKEYEKVVARLSKGWGKVARDVVKEVAG
jgi:hypothetical protein